MKGDKGMDINKIIKRELPIGEDFNYKVLYNDGRGAVHKEDYERLLSYCLKIGIIEVEKYLVEEKVSSEILSDIADQRGKEIYQFKAKLKAYHQEKDYSVSPFIYLLGKIEPAYQLNMERTEYTDPVLNFPVNIKVGHRFERTNAFSRLFFTDCNVAMNSTNDDIETLISTLEIDDVTVYILDTEIPSYDEQDIILYKLTKSNEFKAVKAKVDREISERTSMEYLKF